MKTEAIEGIIARYEEDVERWACLLQISPSERNDAAAARAELAALKAENAWLRSLAIHSEAATKERCAGLVKARRKRLLDDASDKSEDEHKRYVAGKRASEATKLLNAILALPSAYEGCSTVEEGDDG